jgi:signal transduction histidine kinase/CheY-like chemotaxis protein/ABC-type amino acid transport substrate-binding protein
LPRFPSCSPFPAWVLSLALLGGTQAQENPTSVSRRTLTVGLPAPELAPGLLGLDELGQLDGFARRLTERVAERAGLALEFRAIPRGPGEHELASGEVDLVCPLSIDERRVSEFVFTTPILIANAAAFVRSDELPPATFEELGQRRIVIAAAGVAHRFCVEKGLSFELAPSLREALERVRDGRADCVITPQVAGRHEIERLGLTGLADAPLDEEGLRQAFALAMRPGDAELLARLDSSLTETREAGDWERLYDRWVARYQPREHARSWTVLVAALLSVLCVAAVVVLLVLRTRLSGHTQALDQGEHLYRAVAESLPALVYSTFVGDDGRRELRFATANLAEWRARFPALDPGAEHAGILPEIQAEDRRLFEELAQRALGTNGRFDAEFRLRAADGRLHWLHTTATPARVPGGTLWQSLLLDTTPLHEAQEERHRLELQLAQAQRLEGLGLMAGGIAHDFNNLLMEVQGNIELALAAEDAAERSERLALAVAGTRRAAARTQQLLASAGEAPLAEEPLELARVVHAAATAFAERERGRLTLELRLAEPGPIVRGDAGLLGQVVDQLLENAADAIPADGGGCVGVRLRAHELSRDELREFMPRRAPGVYVELEVQDSGTGMDETLLRRIFDPFFSTKFVGRGLGLSLVLATVERHGGAVCVRSAVGRGTTVALLLPLAARQAPERTEVLVPFRSAGARVLVVDDDEPVLEVACSLLHSRGWATLRALDAESALVLAREQRPALVLLDLSMPGTSGLELLRRLRAELPALPVVLMSGYSEDEADDDSVEADAFVSKPFSSDQLVAALELALAERGASGVLSTSSFPERKL